MAGTAVLVLGAVGVESVPTASPLVTSVTINAALALTAVAVALVLPRGKGVPFALAALVGATTLVQSAFSVDLGIDQLLAVDPAPGNDAQPGRMSEATALSLLLLASAHALRTRSPRVSQAAAGTVFLLGFLGILGHAFGADQLYAVTYYSTIALPTASALAVLSVAVLSLVPGGAVAWLLNDRGPGAALARRMVPIALVVLPTLAYARVLGVDRGWYGERFGSAVMVLLAVGVLLFVTWRSVAAVEDIDAARRAAHAELEVANAELAASREFERARAEGLTDSLQSQRQRFDSAVAQLDDLVWTARLTPFGSRLTYLSRETGRLLGTVVRVGSTVHDMVLGGMDATDARDATDATDATDRRLGADFVRKAESGRAAEAEVRRTVGGEERWIWFRGVPRRAGGATWFDGIGTDITERKLDERRREEALRLQEQQVASLTELNQMREEFVAVAGHELRTPLTAIRGFSEVLATDRSLSDTQRRHAETVLRRALQLSELVDQLFDLSRVSTGAVELHVESVSLRRLAEESIADHERVARSGGVALLLSAHDVRTAADPVRLRQVVDNLVSNAVKYSPGGGTVRLLVDSIGGRARLRVVDEGIGIPEDDMPHVFDRMFRSQAARETGIPGTGLGLAVTKALVEAQAGAVQVAANPDGGTIFTVHLPVAGGPESQGPVTER